MRNSQKTKQQLIKENAKLRFKLTKLSHIESEHKKLQVNFARIEKSFPKLLENIDLIALPNSINIQLNAVLEAATLVSIIATDTNGIITIFNSGAEQMLGYKASEMLGKHSPTIFHSKEELETRGIELSKEFSREIKGLNSVVENVRQGKPETREWLYIRKDGKQINVSLSVTALRDAEGNFIGFLGVATDITERKQVHEELQKAKEEAELAAKTKSEFLANMSHEIRTPMNAVIGMTGLLLDTKLSTEQIDYVETIRSSGDALLTIINDILDFSKIEAGKLELEQSPFDIKDCIEESMVLIASKAAEKGLNLTYSIDPLTPRIIVGDMARLRQVLVNLLTNAVKFTKMGEVSITVKASEMEAMSKTNKLEENNKFYQVHFSVKDTGIGIPKDRINNLFQAFTQVDASTTRKYGGTGLGLAISKLLCEMMGGTIWVESLVGVGSAFHFFIISQIDSSQPTHCDLESILVNKNILVVVDDPIDQYFLNQQIESWGMYTRATTLVDEALYWIRDGVQFDVAIIDSDIQNFQHFLQELVNYSPDQNLPVLTLNTAENPVVLKKIEAMETIGSLTKPFNTHHLYEKLTNIFSTLSTKDRQPKTLLEVDYEMALKQPLRLLIAEDNAVNQKVALKMLAKMGYRADIAGNGLEVLDALNRQNYDAILMDLQMPEMDGLEATREIRRRFIENRPRIIAMTANAMPGDREICLEAGMDDYLSKPVRIEQLQTVLKRCYQLPTEKLARKPTERLGGKITGRLTGELQMQPPIDLTILESLQQVQIPGEPNLLLELIDLFVTETPIKLDALRNAFSQKDYVQVRRISHNLKGGSGSLGANPMMKVCAEIEQRCKNNSLESLDSLLIQLEMEFMRAEHVLLKEREKLSK